MELHRRRPDAAGAVGCATRRQLPGLRPHAADLVRVHRRGPGRASTLRRSRSRSTASTCRAPASSAAAGSPTPRPPSSASAAHTVRAIATDRFGNASAAAPVDVRRPRRAAAGGVWPCAVARRHRSGRGADRVRRHGRRHGRRPRQPPGGGRRIRRDRLGLLGRQPLRLRAGRPRRGRAHDRCHRRRPRRERHRTRDVAVRGRRSGHAQPAGLGRPGRDHRRCPCHPAVCRAQQRDPACGCPGAGVEPAPGRRRLRARARR